MWEEENAAPVDAERRDTGDQKSQGVHPPAPPMDWSALRSQQNQDADGKGSKARDEMHPSGGKRSRFIVPPPPVLPAVQLLLKKSDHCSVEVAMKGGPIEPRRVLADVGHPLRECRAARGDEREMIGTRHKVQLWR